MNPKLTQPSQALVNGRRYTRAVDTNVRETWISFGWQPPSREEQHAKLLRLNPLPIPEERLYA